MRLTKASKQNYRGLLYSGWGIGAKNSKRGRRFVNSFLRLDVFCSWVYAVERNFTFDTFSMAVQQEQRELSTNFSLNCMKEGLKKF